MSREQLQMPMPMMQLESAYSDPSHLLLTSWQADDLTHEGAGMKGIPGL